ncbi:MAG: hypothetical protein WBA43_21750 [Elainellaceae cyanobacterium]
MKYKLFPVQRQEFKVYLTDNSTEENIEIIIETSDSNLLDNYNYHPTKDMGSPKDVRIGR